MEGQREFQVLVQVIPSVVAGTQRVLMRKILCRKLLVQELGSGLKAIPIVISTIEIELELGESLGVLREGEGIIFVKVLVVQRRAKGVLRIRHRSQPGREDALLGDLSL